MLNVYREIGDEGNPLERRGVTESGAPLWPFSANVARMPDIHAAAIRANRSASLIWRHAAARRRAPFYPGLPSMRIEGFSGSGSGDDIPRGRVFGCKTGPLIIYAEQKNYRFPVLIAVRQRGHDKQYDANPRTEDGTDFTYTLAAAAVQLGVHWLDPGRICPAVPHRRQHDPGDLPRCPPMPRAVGDVG